MLRRRKVQFERIGYQTHIYMISPIQLGHPLDSALVKPGL